MASATESLRISILISYPYTNRTGGVRFIQNNESVTIAQWEDESISLSAFSMAWVQFPAMAEYFKGYFTG